MSVDLLGVQNINGPSKHFKYRDIISF